MGNLKMPVNLTSSLQDANGLQSFLVTRTELAIWHAKHVPSGPTGLRACKIYGASLASNMKEHADSTHTQRRDRNCAHNPDVSVLSTSLHGNSLRVRCILWVKTAKSVYYIRGLHHHREGSVTPNTRAANIQNDTKTIDQLQGIVLHFTEIFLWMM